MTGLFRINLEVDWKRNLDPGLKVASMAASYGRDSRKPGHCAFRASFWNEGHARRWITENSLRTIGGKFIPLLAIDANGDRKLIIRFALDFMLGTELPSMSCNARALDRIHRIFRACDRSGYKLEWQAPQNITRLYQTLQQFQTELKIDNTSHSSQTAASYPERYGS